MKAMVLHRPGTPLELMERAVPEPAAGQVRVRVSACAVCRTDLHVVDGELAQPSLPLVPGHQVVGVVDGLGSAVTDLKLGQRVGIPWLASTCGCCPYCLSQRENLCDRPQFTGYTVDGGFADYTLADPRYCFEVPPALSDVHAAPLLCAGLIGYRALTLAGPGRRLGLYGFGAAAHILTQVGRHLNREIYAFVRPGDEEARQFALELGAVWAGWSDQAPPQPLDAAILFAPVGALVPLALAQVCKGGTVVCGGIHMSDIPAFPYRLLWEERTVRSVANLTRRDGMEFLPIAAAIPVRTEVQTYALEEANQALDDLRSGRVRGAAVLQIR